MWLFNYSRFSRCIPCTIWRTIFIKRLKTKRKTKYEFIINKTATNNTSKEMVVECALRRQVIVKEIKVFKTLFFRHEREGGGGYMGEEPKRRRWAPSGAHRALPWALRLNQTHPHGSAILGLTYLRYKVFIQGINSLKWKLWYQEIEIQEKKILVRHLYKGFVSIRGNHGNFKRMNRHKVQRRKMADGRSFRKKMRSDKNPRSK